MGSVKVLPVPLEPAFEKRLSSVSQDDSYFAFARIRGELQLVQGEIFPDNNKKLNWIALVSVSDAKPISALTTVDVKLFRHEFITIFRFAGLYTLHPADINIIEPIDTNLTRYEEDNETVFLARDVIDRMRKLTDPRRTMGMGMIPGRSLKGAHQNQFRLQTVRRHQWWTPLEFSTQPYNSHQRPLWWFALTSTSAILTACIDTSYRTFDWFLSFFLFTSQSFDLSCICIFTTPFQVLFLAFFTLLDLGRYFHSHIFMYHLPLSPRCAVKYNRDSA